MSEFNLECEKKEVKKNWEDVTWKSKPKILSGSKYSSSQMKRKASSDHYLLVCVYVFKHLYPILYHRVSGQVTKRYKTILKQAI